MKYNLIRVNGKNPFKQEHILKPFILKPCFNKHCTTNKNYVVFVDNDNCETYYFLVEYLEEKETYCNQCGFVGDDEDFKEHIKETSHTGYKGKKLIRKQEDFKNKEL